MIYHGIKPAEKIMVKLQINAITFLYFNVLIDMAKEIMVVIKSAPNVPTTVTKIVSP
jgi:hypothetical protein